MTTSNQVQRHDIAKALDRQAARREAFFRKTRERIADVFAPDGTGLIQQFRPPYREPVWILPALLSGDQQYVDLANRIVERYNRPADGSSKSGRVYGIFQSNAYAHLLHCFGDRLSDNAREAMTWHALQVTRTLHGSGQPDTKFHGGNDNFPMLCSMGLILAGEALGDWRALEHGVWNLNQFRRLLSRSAWAGEYNSSTYTAVTLKAAAQIASFSHHEEVRQLARDIEHRLWAEVLLHYHPGTFRQAGPQSRAYTVDLAGHNHSLQLLLWLMFGEALSGRDILRSYFEPDHTEVVHFYGHYFQNIAEYCDMIAASFHVPPKLSHLIDTREYPAMHRGRTEVMDRCDGRAAESNTCTYMEESFSVGSVSGPWFGGDQTASPYLTYRLTERVSGWRDASTAYLRFSTGEAEVGKLSPSVDGSVRNEVIVRDGGWHYAIQKKNVVATLTCPNPAVVGSATTALKLKVVFPAHYGQIHSSIIGDGPVRSGIGGESMQVVPVSVQAGEVFIHIQPLLPTCLPRRAAIRFVRENAYEVLELVNYEGELREFAAAELARVLNGLVMTVKSRRDFSSLADFHAALSKLAITDYLSAGHRYFLFQRDDVEFDVIYTPASFGVQTEAIDGRHVPRPIFSSNQLDVDQLPFMTGTVARNAPLFPWSTLETPPWPNTWVIGSRGLPGEQNYSCPTEGTTEPPGQSTTFRGSIFAHTRLK